MLHDPLRIGLRRNFWTRCVGWKELSLRHFQLRGYSVEWDVQLTGSKYETRINPGIF